MTADAEQLGITAPAAKPTLSSSSSSPKYYIASIDVTDPGYGYETEPAVTIAGFGGAQAKAQLLGSRVRSVDMLEYGDGYTSPPAVTIAAPTGSSQAGSGAVLAVATTGTIINALVTSGGSNYTSAPSVTLSGGGTPSLPAVLRASINEDGQLQRIEVLDPGEGYSSEPTIALSGGGGSGGTARAVVAHRVTGVTVTTAGSGYKPADQVRFSGTGGGAYAEATLTSSGGIASVAVLANGLYREPPTASMAPSRAEAPRTARARAVANPCIKGKYWAAIRYVDDTSESRGGPIASSISELAEIEITSAAGSISWSWSNAGMEARAHKIELWRTTADQSLVLYRVAVLDKTATSFTDTIGDNALIDPERLYNGQKVFSILPIVLPNGQVNARRFNPPPRNKRVVTMFQDRAWYAVDVPGRTFDYTANADYAEPNAIYFSEVDEPESVPQTNQLVIQENVKGQDKITALMPFGGGLVVFQTRHAYRLSYAAQPVIDASIQLITQRGCLNQRCWDVHEGVAYVADSSGLYALDGTNVQPLSDPVSTFWSDGGIDFSQSKWFFVRVDPVTDIVRFHFSPSGGYPDRALCYRAATKAWWLEQYAQTMAASECLDIGGRQRLIVGGQAGGMMLFDSGSQDLNAAGQSVPVACYMRTGAMALSDDRDRHMRVIYRPTTADCQLSLGLHYNNSSSPRPSAIATDRGSGFTTSQGGAATLNLKTSRSALGDATGYAICHYSGRVDDRSAGADRHISLALSATRPASESLLLYGIALSGAG